MKYVTLKFTVPDNYPEKKLLQDLAISIMLQQYKVNTVIVESPLKDSFSVYDLEPYRQELRRLPRYSKSDKNESNQ